MIRFRNNWSALLTVAASAVDTVFTISPTFASLLTNASVDDPYWVTLDVGDGTWEIVHVTGVSGGDLTVVRGQEGSTAIAWPVNSFMEIRITAALLELVQTVESTADPDSVVIVPTSGGITIDMTAGRQQMLDADVGGLITVLTPTDPSLYYEVELWTPNFGSSTQSWTWAGVDFTDDTVGLTNGSIAAPGAPVNLFSYGGVTSGRLFVADYDTFRAQYDTIHNT